MSVHTSSYGCIICQEAFLSNEETVKHPMALNCGHVFHNDCLQKWLVNTKSCPVCRFKVVENASNFHRLHLQSVNSLDDTAFYLPSPKQLNLKKEKENEELLDKMKQIISVFKDSVQEAKDLISKTEASLAKINTEAAAEVPASPIEATCSVNDRSMAAPVRSRTVRQIRLAPVVTRQTNTVSNPNAAVRAARSAPVSRQTVANSNAAVRIARSRIHSKYYFLI